MTREEAIKEFEYGIISDEAVKMAIKALEQEPRKDEVILTKKEYGELVSSEFENGYAKGYREALEEQETCEDAVSKQEIQQKINRLWNSNGDKNYCMETLKDFVTELQLVTPTPKWIPVSERLPEESLNSVIGWDAYRERCVFVQYIDGYFQITGRNESFNIVAWQPLPKPYVPDTNVGKMEEMESKDGN